MEYKTLPLFRLKDPVPFGTGFIGKETGLPIQNSTHEGSSHSSTLLLSIPYLTRRHLYQLYQLFQFYQSVLFHNIR